MHARMTVLPAQASKWEVQLKSDNSPLTRADSAANQIICDELTVGAHDRGDERAVSASGKTISVPA